MEINPGIIKIAAVFVGAGSGGVLRHLIAHAVQQWFGAAAPAWSPLPFGTLFVNMTGCLAIGLLAALLAGATPAREELRLLLLVGVLGGYTTFSAFGRETVALAHEGRWLFAMLNVVLSNVLGIGAVFAGERLAAIITGRGAA